MWKILFALLAAMLAPAAVSVTTTTSVDSTVPPAEPVREVTALEPPVVLDLDKLLTEFGATTRAADIPACDCSLPEFTLCLQCCPQLGACMLFHGPCDGYCNASGAPACGLCA